MLLKTRLGLVPLAFGISKGTCCISILLLLMIQCTELFSISDLLGAAQLLEQKAYPWNAAGILTLQQRFWLTAPRSQMPWGASLCRGDMTLSCCYPASQSWGTQGRDVPKYFLFSSQQQQSNRQIISLAACSALTAGPALPACLWLPQHLTIFRDLQQNKPGLPWSHCWEGPCKEGRTAHKGTRCWRWSSTTILSRRAA